MDVIHPETEYRDRSLLVRLFGVAALLAGLSIAFIGPLEMICFYWFGEGGRFHYPGFRFGSFMFANIAAQIACYYAIGIALIVLGYGHLARRRWVRPLVLAGLSFWRLLGLPLSLVFLVVLVASKEVTPAFLVLTVVLLAAAYLGVPWWLRRFYRSRDLLLTLETRDPHEHWLEQLSTPILTLCLLYLFYEIALHIPILLNGLYPLFGTFLTRLPGIAALDVSIWVLAALTWGTFKRQRWAWWGGLAYWGGLTLSTVVSLASTGYLELLDLLALPPREIEFLDGVPLQGVHLALFFGLVFALPLGWLIACRKHFGPNPGCSSKGPMLE
jgi:hypothetical protein